MEKEMLAIARIKSGEGKFEKFMGFMQSDEGMAVRKTVAHVEKTVPAVAPDKSYVMFKVSVHNEENMKQFVTGQNPIAKPIFDECIESVQMWEMSKVNL
jgi:hypothetical protein